MKKIYNILLSIAAVFSFALTTNAQYTQHFDGIGDLTFKGDPDDIGDNTEMGFSKHISSPVKGTGTYYIKLEAFAKGEAKKTSEPSDFVLVLDISGSMNQSMGTGSGSRLKALQDAVISFINQIDTNDKKDMGGNDRSSRLGNRISIVTFSSTATVKKVNNVELVRLGNSISDNSGATALIGIVNSLSAKDGTNAHEGMKEAYRIINFDDNTRKLRTVVLFTDGNPGEYGMWKAGWSGNYYYDTDDASLTWESAEKTIEYADKIKKIHTESNGIVSNVFTVSIIPESLKTDQTEVYLGKTSSNYIDATTMGWDDITLTDDGRIRGWKTNIWANGNGRPNPDATTDYALSASSASELEAAFNTIAGIVGDAKNNELTSSSTTVDVISSSFTLPGTTPNPSQIKVYTVLSGFRLTPDGVYP